VPAIETSLLILLEPALNPLWAWLLAGERPPPAALAGGAVILGAAILHAARSARSPTRAADGPAAGR
jgi:drug/metabolite transporter (DMT)-like permease